MFVTVTRLYCLLVGLEYLQLDCEEQLGLLFNIQISLFKQDDFQLLHCSRLPAHEFKLWIKIFSMPHLIEPGKVFILELIAELHESKFPFYALSQ